MQVAVGDVHANYNLSRGQSSLMIRADKDGGYLGCGYWFSQCRWGFRPDGSTDTTRAFPIVRAESLIKKPAFAQSFFHKRCVVPVSGWFEWVYTGYYKQPYYVTHINSDRDQVLFLAGIWDYAGSRTSSCFAIITEPSSGHLVDVHQRQPVILDESCVKEWLDPDIQEQQDIKKIVRRLPQDQLIYYPVSTLVNDETANDPSLIQPIMIK